MGEGLLSSKFFIRNDITVKSSIGEAFKPGCLKILAFRIFKLSKSVAIFINE